MRHSKYTSKQRFQQFKHVDKRFLVQYVSKKLNGRIKLYHISAVISFLFDELIEELRAGSIITIGKFGKFFLKHLRIRRYHDVIERKIKMTPGNKTLRFQLQKDIQKILTNSLDIAKTFGDH